MIAGCVSVTSRPPPQHWSLTARRRHCRCSAERIETPVAPLALAPLQWRSGLAKEHIQMTAKRLVLAALLSLATAASASAQGNPTGTISGRVLSDAGALPGVTVTATSPGLQGSRTAVSDGERRLHPAAAAAGHLQGDASSCRDSGPLRADHQRRRGQTVPVNVALTVAAATETVHGHRADRATSRRPRR